MELILLRHGKAEDHHPEGDDRRALVEKGRKQSRKAGRLLLSVDRRPDVVLTSPRLRALQTAEEFCSAADMPGPVLQSWLDCGMDPESAVRELLGFSEFERVMIVGHEPDFSNLIEFLLGATSASVEVKKGALAGIEVEPPSNRGRLLYLIGSKMMGRGRKARSDAGGSEEGS